MPKIEHRIDLPAAKFGLAEPATLTLAAGQDEDSSGDETPAEPLPDSQAPFDPDTIGKVDNAELLALIREAVEQVLLDAPAYPAPTIDARDVINVISNKQLYHARLRDLPGSAGGGVYEPPLPDSTSPEPTSPDPDEPASDEPETPDEPPSAEVPGDEDTPTPAPITQAPALATGYRATVSLWDTGGRGESYSADTKALVEALKRVAAGGTVLIPAGSWKIAEAIMPAHKSYIIQGENELRSTLCGAAQKDMLIWDAHDEQRRLENRRVLRNLRFFMPGNGARGSFKRKTVCGWQAGAACLAFVQRNQTADGNRKQAWGPSYLTLENITGYADKNAVGATLLWSDRALYGFRARNIFLGTHSSTRSGMPGGIIFGVPPFSVAEYAPDEFRVETFVHWGGQCSIAVSNIANGAIVDHKAYTCKHPLHLTGQANNGPRKRCRDMEIRECYYDNDALVTSPGDPPMIVIDTEGADLGTIHLKGTREGTGRPLVKISGQDVMGGQFRIMSSTIHKAPQFQISGEGHQFMIRAGGVVSAERATLINGGSSYAGISVR